MPVIDGDLPQLAVFAFGTRPYWGRLWIVQELALAQHATVHYGRQKLSLEYLRMAEPVITSICQISTIFESQLHLPTRASSVRDMTRTLKSLEAIRSRLHDKIALKCKIVASLGEQKTSDDRGKIYALISINEREYMGHGMITVDYNKTVEEVYVEFAQYVVDKGEAFHLLRLAVITSSRHGHSGGLPTWIPDWRACDHRGVYKQRKRNCVEGKCEGGVSLWTKGRKVAGVQRQLTVPFLSTEQHDLPQRRVDFQGFLQDLVTPRSGHIQGESRMQQLFRLVILRRFGLQSGQLKTALGGFLQRIFKYIRSLDLSVDEENIYIRKIGLTLLDDRATEKDVDDLRDYGQELFPTTLSHTFDSLLLDWVNDSRVFLTHDGELGLG